MWKRRNRQRSQTAASAAPSTVAPFPPPSLVNAAPTPSPPIPSSAPLQAPSIVAPRLSPLQMTFDFELASTANPKPISRSFDPDPRPKTSDGQATAGHEYKQSTLSLLPPILPPIPRVASKEDSLNSALAQTFSGRARDESDNSSQASKKPWLSFFNRSNERLPVLKPQPSASTLSFQRDAAASSRPSTAGASNTAKMDSTLFSKDDPVSVSELSGGAPKMAATMFPIPSSPLSSQNNGPSSSAMNRSFVDRRDKSYGDKPPPRRPANIQIGPSVPSVLAAPSFAASPIALPSPNMLSVPSPMSINFTPSLRDKRLTMMSTTSSMSLRAPSISGTRLSPGSPRISAIPRSPTLLSPATSSFGPNTLNVGRKSISGARLSPQSSFDTLKKEMSPDRGSAVRTSWLAPEWTFEVDQPATKPPPIPESLLERPGSSGSFVAASFRGSGPTFPAPPLSDLHRTQTSASTKSTKLPPHPSVYYEPTAVHDQRPSTRASRPHLLSTKSSPNLRDTSPATVPPQSDLSGATMPRASDLGGTTARASTKSTPMTDATPARSRKSTIGTPYVETSDAFPMPQIVAVRPSTAGGSSTVGGTLVPTHYTSSNNQPEKVKAKMAKNQREKEKQETVRQVKAKLEQEKLERVRIDKEREENARREMVKAEKQRQGRARQESPRQDKVERRKTRLLNPMTLLGRKRSETPTEMAIRPSVEEQTEQRQAFARQKSVAAIGVDRLPANYDPRIKGKVVHDFSTPRRSSTRNFSYNEQDWEAEKNMATGPRLVAVPALEYDPPPQEENFRRSVHSPHFREMLNEEPEAEARVSSLHAEALENKDFLQRASRQSTSQESAILPPFARRSQQMQLDAGESSALADTDSKRSSDPSSVDQSIDRNSAISASSMVSPITQRSSTIPPGLRDSGSPISPSSPGGKSARSSAAEMPLSMRPASAGSRLLIPPLNFDTIVEQPPDDAQHSPHVHDIAPIPQLFLPDFVAPASPTSRPLPSHRDSSQAPEAIVFPSHEDSRSPIPSLRVLETEASSLPKQDVAQPYTASGGNSALPTLGSTPEIIEGEQELVTMQAPRSPPRLVEKRASASEDAQPGSLIPKHQGSNASRFSFQFGGSAQEEGALEEKHRKNGKSLKDADDTTSSDVDDDEDSFDEDAIHDMDEMEVQEQQAQGDVPMPAALALQQARQQLQAPSSSSGSMSDERNSSEATDERYLTYADHPAYRAYDAMNEDVAGSAAHSRHTSGGSGANQPSWRDNDILRYIDGYSSHHLRDLSEASVLTVNTNVVQSPTRETFFPQASPTNDRHVAGHGDRADTPRLTSALSTTATEMPDKHGSVLSMSTVRSAGNSATGALRVSGPTTLGPGSRPETASDVRSQSRSSGFALSAFDDLNFGDGPDLSMAESRPMSREQAFHLKRRTKDSETIPDWRSAMSHQYSSGDNSSGRNTRSPAFFPPGRDSTQNMTDDNRGIRVREASKDRIRASTPGDHDDMYFDDGGFEQDIVSKQGTRPVLDEESLDSETFPSRSNGFGRYVGHQRENSAMTVTSLSGDGPFPTFAMGANPTKALQRQSQLLLADLPLQQGTIESNLILQRNPSEDAKRMGLSDRVPPLPAQQDSKEATASGQKTLQAYHAALADAANRAAADGRFSRMPSGASSLAQSLSVYSKAGDDASSPLSKDDRSHYSRDEDGNAQTPAAPVHGLGLSHGLSSGLPNDPGLDHNTSGGGDSPPKMNFDFGFGGAVDAQPEWDDTPGMHDDICSDDDVIAAANAEALANDDEGFYGHEFGFYAKARADSNELEAINGGFFGEDGDHGLTRNKSLKEPNLTPITERSEFSTRNSFINSGHSAMFAPASAGPLNLAGLVHGSPGMARLPGSPLPGPEIASFDQLRKLRADAFGGSTGSTGSDGKGTPSHPFTQSPTHSARSSAVAAPGYAYSGPPGSAQHAIPSPQQPPQDSPQQNHQDSFPSSLGSSHIPHPDTTARKASTIYEASAVAGLEETDEQDSGHSRQSSETVTYVREDDPSGTGPARWVVERRRTSEHGQPELIGREVVRGGWI